MRNLSIKIILAALLVSISGCIGVKNTVYKPEELIGKGYLVARIDGNDSSFSYASYSGDAIINGQAYEDKVIKHYLVLPLPPGQYKLEELKNKSGNKYSGYTYNAFTFNHEFIIKPGHLTNLGYLFGDFSSNTKYIGVGVQSGRYRILTVNNNNSILDYLKMNQPHIHKVVSNKKIINGKLPFATKKQLNSFRQYYANHLTTIPVHKSSDIVHGQLGTLAIVKRNPQGDVLSTKVIETNSNEFISGCSSNKTRFICTVPDINNPRFIIGQLAGRYKSLPIPGKTSSINAYIIGKSNVLAIDGSLNIYISHDNGKSFTLNSNYSSNDESGMLKDIKYSNGINGIYIASRIGKDKLLYITNQAQISSIPLPESGIIGKIIETNTGLLMGPEATMMMNSKVFFKPKGENEWIESEMPVSGCIKAEFEDSSRNNLLITCGYGYRNVTFYRSNDGGRTWK